MKKTIHVVEDDADIGELIAFLLREQCYSVSVFDDVASFKQGLMTGPLPELVVLDVMLPDADGLDVCQEWKTDTHTRHIPLLLMSAYEDNRSHKKAHYANGFVGKPFDIKVFVSTVQRLL